MTIYELRKQPVDDESGKHTKVIKTEIFKSRLGELTREARQLGSEDPKNFYWVYANQKEAKNVVI